SCRRYRSTQSSTFRLLGRQAGELEEHGPDRRVIEISATRGGQRVHELTDDRRGWGGHAVRSRRFARNPEILLIQAGAKPGRVVPLQHPLAVDFEDAAGCKAAQ